MFTNFIILIQNLRLIIYIFIILIHELKLIIYIFKLKSNYLLLD